MYDRLQLASAFSDKRVADSLLEEAYRSIDNETGFSVETHGEGRIVRVSNETGEGTMRFETLMPGVVLTFNDFNMASCFSGFSSSENHLSVNYCKSGRIEQALPGGTCWYTAQGDFKISDFEHHAGTYVFPTGHYQGVAIDFDIELCQEALGALLGNFSIDLGELRARFCRSSAPYVIRDFVEGERIFGGLYDIELRKLKTYAQVAAFDTLVALDRMEYRAENQSVEYFQRAQVEKVKRAHAIMTQDITRSFTVERLAQAVGLPTTTFKTCFKGVYGAPPYAYLRAYRMDRAAELLRSSDRSAAEIGASVGYDSPSKFTAAFKAVMGQTPSAFRRAN